jgi:hypothetical protein
MLPLLLDYYYCEDKASESMLRYFDAFPTTVFCVLSSSSSSYDVPSMNEESRTHRTSSRSSYSLDYFYSETEGKKSFAFAPLFLREIDNGVKSRWSRSLYLYRRCCCRVLHTLPYCRIRIYPIALFGSLSLTVSSVRSLLLASTTGNSFY